MSDVTAILCAISRGDPLASEQLLPVVYEELRRMARLHVAKEPPGLTLQATALVHEAYLRLVGQDPPPQWNSKAHFFGAAAEAMRRILIERVRRHRARKRGGEDAQQIDLTDDIVAVNDLTHDILAIDDALIQLEQHDPVAAQLVKLRYFVGLGHQEAAETMGIDRRAADRLWLLARTWLFRSLRQ